MITSIFPLGEGWLLHAAVSEDNVELLMLLYLPSKCWDYPRVPRPALFPLVRKQSDSIWYLARIHYVDLNESDSGALKTGMLCDLNEVITSFISVLPIFEESLRFRLYNVSVLWCITNTWSTESAAKVKQIISSHHTFLTCIFLSETIILFVVWKWWAYSSIQIHDHSRGFHSLAKTFGSKRGTCFKQGKSEPVSGTFTKIGVFFPLQLVRMQAWSYSDHSLQRSYLK